MMKNFRGEADGGKRIIEFQKRLLEGVRPLEAAYFATKQEERRLIRNKGRYKANWFKRRISKLSSYRKALLDAIAVSRALGDGFVWLFYESNWALIREHLKQPRQPLLPIGIGGEGERIVAATITNLDGRLVIYHGFTSFLRMGDVSLINLKTLNVDSIGEFKTNRISETHYTIHFSFIADSREKLPEADKSISLDLTPLEALDPFIQHKLSRQVEAIGNALRRAKQNRPDAQFGGGGKLLF